MITALRRSVAYWLFGVAGHVLPEPERIRLLRVLRTGDPEERVPIEDVIRR